MIKKVVEAVKKSYDEYGFVYEVCRKFNISKRSVKFWYQRRTRGWDDSETWSLDHTLAQIILPRLKRLKELKCGYPSHLSEKPIEEYDKYDYGAEKKWDEIIDEMIAAFEIVADEDRWYAVPSDEDLKIYKKGMKKFCKYYTDLWW